MNYTSTLPAPPAVNIYYVSSTIAVACQGCKRKRTSNSLSLLVASRGAAVPCREQQTDTNMHGASFSISVLTKLVMSSHKRAQGDVCLVRSCTNAEKVSSKIGLANSENTCKPLSSCARTYWIPDYCGLAARQPSAPPNYGGRCGQASKTLDAKPMCMRACALYV